MVGRLKRRSEFLRVARARRKWSAPGLILQAGPSEAEAPNAAPVAAMRVGFTASKKVGGAVKRNRAKRRLRAIAQQILPGAAMPGFDYVLIARAATLTRPADRLSADLETALKKLGVDRDALGPEDQRRQETLPAAP
jgi:ribonuclease P protein component